ncbi:MAG: FAD-dependent oxidoreductase [Granulosicoccus sp.]|nr:FAD-dependent oxidoreductase [Granulosicoccus sp.]
MGTQFPEHASVVVIGGGIMGCSTLYHLAKLGVTDAVLLERNQLTSGTTWHSAAQVRALRSSRNLTRMIQYSVDLYSQLEQETGQSVGWIQKGSLSIATQPDRLTHIQRQESLAKAYGIEALSVSTQEAAERWPLMHSADILGAVWSPHDGRVSPSDVCAALIKSARSMGASLFEKTGVTGVHTDQGRVTAVETSQGRIRCDAIALCAGLWSRELGAMAGADVPVQACEHFYLLTKPVDGITGNMPTLSDHDSHLYIRDDSGGLLVGCFEPLGKAIPPGVLDDNFEFGLLPEDWDHFEPMMQNALHRLPVLETAEVRMLLNGPESFTPDGTFMLGETAETRGLFLGCGMNSVGIASGGGAGMNLAHCIVHGKTAYDLSEADAKRFAPAFNSLDHLLHRAPEILGAHYEISYPARQLSSARNLRGLPLDKEHRECKAVMGQFYGWERPLYFNAMKNPRPTFDRPDYHELVHAEVQAAHTQAGVFDLSSFGKLDVIGKDAQALLMQICAGYVDRAPGSVVYSAVLNSAGTFESDLTVQRMTENHYRLFTGTNALKRDKAWFERHAEGFDVEIYDVTEDYAVLALMGPDTARIASELGSGISTLGFFRHASDTLADITIRAARMSYVGEPGWEITCAADDASVLYAALRGAGATPCGLFAQTSMRIEKGYCAMGHELDSDVSPVDVALDMFTRKAGGFCGFDALQEKRAAVQNSRLVSLLFDNPEAVPLGHEPVYYDNAVVGTTTSSAFGFRVGRPVALALISDPMDSIRQVEVDIAGRKFSAKLSRKPLYDPAGVRMKSHDIS